MAFSRLKSNLKKKLPRDCSKLKGRSFFRKKEETKRKRKWVSGSMMSTRRKTKTYNWIWSSIQNRESWQVFCWKKAFNMLILHQERLFGQINLVTKSIISKGGRRFPSMKITLLLKLKIGKSIIIICMMRMKRNVRVLCFKWSSLPTSSVSETNSESEGGAFRAVIFNYLILERGKKNDEMD